LSGVWCKVFSSFQNPVTLIYKADLLDLPRHERPVVLGARRFTLAGLCVAGGFIVAGAVGVDIENTVTYQSFALLLAFLLLALASSFFSAPNFPRRARCRASARPASRCTIACR
jgi:hypothetical protein